MRNIKFFDCEEDEEELPMKDFEDELKATMVDYGYITTRYYDNTYEQNMIHSATGYVNKHNSSVIFLNPRAIWEGNVVESIVHETLHIVIWKHEKEHNSERVVRRMLNEPLSMSHFFLA